MIMKPKHLLVIIIFLCTTCAGLTQSYSEYYNSGLKKYNDGQYVSALADLQKAGEIKKTESDLFNITALCYYMLSNFNNALSNINKAITIKNDIADYYFNRGLINGELGGDSYAAINDYTLAIKYNSDYANAYANRGVKYCNVDNWEKGCTDLKKALELGDMTVKQMINQYCK